MTGAARPPAFVNDLETCVGCHACVVACANENQLAPGTSWRHVVTFNEPRRAGIPTFHLSLACNHCRDAPCLRYCPARAISRHATSGAVLIDEHACIGCRYCSWVCPYDAPRFDGDAGVMRKCTLCNDRLSGGLAPACVSACPVGALTLGDPVEAEPVGVAGFPLAGIGPGIRFLPMRARAGGRHVGMTAPAPAVAHDVTVTSPKISSRSEWTLVAFTLVAEALVGIVLMAALVGADLPVVPLLAVGALAIVASTLHLGRPLRAWRAGLNLRHSWLSREVVSWPAFLALAGWAFALAPAPALVPRWSAAVAGLACLACIDRVYVVMARHARGRMDDVSALTAGLLLAAVATGTAWLTTALAAWRISAHVMRPAPARGSLAATPWWVPARATLAAVGVALIWTGRAPHALAFAAVLAAELLDRISFYDTLDIVTPRAQALRDTAATFHRSARAQSH